MKPGQLPKSLDDLIAQAEHYAEFCMRGRGRVPPTFLALCPGRLLFYMPESMGDERAKNSFANTARLVCIAHDATAVVMVLEAWMKMASPGETLDPTEAPSEAFDRREVVVLAGEARGSKKQKFLPILRTDAGGFFGFGESDIPQFDNFQGRFAELLPPHAGTPDLKAQARLLLQVMGITDSTLQGDPRRS
jgi:hypothetical protein